MVMSSWKDYNWKSTGPDDGCDSHCIQHPCGVCIAPELNPDIYIHKLEKAIEQAIKELKTVNFGHDAPIRFSSPYLIGKVRSILENLLKNQ